MVDGMAETWFTVSMINTDPMARSTRPEQHYILERNGETIACDKVGARAGFGAYARMMHRMAAAAGVDFLRPTNEDGTVFEGGFVLAGPFQTL